MYYGTVIQYVGRYLWKLEDYLPRKNIQIWDMFQGHTQEYFTSIRIRDAVIGVWEELKRNFLIEDRKQPNYAALDYVQRMQLIDDEKGDIEGILIERDQWE